MRADLFSVGHVGLAGRRVGGAFAVFLGGFEAALDAGVEFVELADLGEILLPGCGWLGRRGSGSFRI